MMKKMWRSVTIWVVATLTVNFGRSVSADAPESSVAKAFRDTDIVPQLVPYPPNMEAKVVYAGGVEVQLGNQLSVLQVTQQPSVTWQNGTGYYTLVMIDPDAPSRSYPILRSIQHWTVVDIPGNNVAFGKVLAGYLPPSPPLLSGFHRYIFLVYPQLGLLTCYKTILFMSIINRTNFNVNKFAKDCNLGKPVAGNFYKVRFLSIVGY